MGIMRPQLQLWSQRWGRACMCRHRLSADPGAAQGGKFRENNLLKGKSPERANRLSEGKQVQQSCAVARKGLPHTYYFRLFQCKNSNICNKNTQGQAALLHLDVLDVKAEKQALLTHMPNFIGSQWQSFWNMLCIFHNSANSGCSPFDYTP